VREGDLSWAGVLAAVAVFADRSFRTSGSMVAAGSAFLCDRLGVGSMRLGNSRRVILSFSKELLARRRERRLGQGALLCNGGRTRRRGKWAPENNFQGGFVDDPPVRSTWSDRSIAAFN